jgi:hypothetical protein
VTRFFGGSARTVRGGFFATEAFLRSTSSVMSARRSAGRCSAARCAAWLRSPGELRISCHLRVAVLLDDVDALVRAMNCATSSVNG